MPTLTERLHARGWRMTSQRRVISAVFDESGAQDIHLTADEVLERATAALPEISRATVYNTLGELVEAGELLAVRVGDRITRYDPNIAEEHHHLVCTGCGAIFDIPASAVALPQADGFTVISAEIIYRGLCSACG